MRESKGAKGYLLIRETEVEGKKYREMERQREGESTYW